LFVLLQAARVWILATLGARWTTRIIIVPGETLVARGPYRFIKHPNYAVVVGEIAVLPLVFGLPVVALVFTLLNAGVLFVRIRAENRALGGSLDARPA
jgi:methyltransferase